MTETSKGFETRKADHIRLSLDPQTEATGLSGLNAFKLVHEALPDIDFDDINLQCTQLKKTVGTPFLISSMTAGHKDGLKINKNLMAAAQKQDWAMGVGSQRRELFDKDAHLEWLNIRKNYPKLRVFGNIGIAQAITSSTSDLQRLVNNLNANALQIHLNPLQECIQGEGTTQFKGSYKAIEKVCSSLSVPVIIKETGCGISKSTMQRLNNTGITALDVSGCGGTHWGRIEGLRGNDDIKSATSQTFKNWGISTLDSMLNTRNLKLDYEIWGSGGIRTGLDAAKLLVLGANTVGFARPMLEAAIKSELEVIQTMKTIEYELKTALFCTGHATIKQLKETYNAML
jgi:isopentenyl-diphosphate delta-isomerase